MSETETLWNEVGYYAVKFAGMGTDCKKENVKKLGIDAINNFAEQIKQDAEAKSKALEEQRDIAVEALREITHIFKMDYEDEEVNIFDMREEIIAVKDTAEQALKQIKGE